MRRSTILASLAAWSLGVASPNLRAQGTSNSDSGPVVSTGGTGQILLQPDRAVLYLETESRAPTAAQAAAANRSKLATLVDSLNAARTPGDSVFVVSVTVERRENYQTGNVRGYAATGTVRVDLHALDRLAEVLDRAYRLGAISARDIAFVSDHEDAGRREAIARAYERAHDNADALVRAAGMRLGALMHLSTGTETPAFPSVLRLEPGVVESRSVPVAPQEVRVTATVDATWRVVPN